jgi:hypothetical protein
MKERKQIRPEWVPSAYRDEKPGVRGKGGAAKTELTAPLYSAKKSYIKTR